MKNYLFVFLGIIFQCYVFGQNLVKTNTYTTENGLPANYLHQTIVDKYGMLWIGTSNGVSRFDGKRFVNYSVKDGLPSNEAMLFCLDKSGTLWVSCFLSVPAYFDYLNNKFIKVPQYEKMAPFKSNLYLIDLINKDKLVFRNEKNNFLFRENQLIETKAFFYNEINKLPINITLSLQGKNSVLKIVNLTNKNAIDSLYHNYHIQITKIKYYKNFYVSFTNKGNELLVFEITKDYKFKPKLLLLPQNEEIIHYNFSNENIFFTTKSGKAYKCSIDGSNVQMLLQYNDEITYVTEDSNGSIWLSTINSGLIQYKNTEIKSHPLPAQMNPNLISICVSSQNKIYAGNYESDLLVHDKVIGFKKYNLNFGTFWIRGIVEYNNNVLIITDWNVFLNGKKINYKNKFFYNFKKVLKINDYDIVMSCMGGLTLFETKTQKISMLNSPAERIYSIVKESESSILYVASKGVFRCNINSKRNELIFDKSLNINGEISGVIFDKTLGTWIYTTIGDLYQIKNNKIINKVKTTYQLPNQINCAFIHKNTIWLGSPSGIYSVELDKNKNAKINNFTTADGLNSNYIKAFDFKNDTIYVASSLGINKLPVHYKRIVNKSKVQLIKLKVNNQPVPLAHVYNLKSYEKNIIIELSGIDLNGHFKNFQFKINQSKAWYNVEGNLLNLMLSNGSNTITIRSVNSQNEIGNEVTRLQFNIDTPLLENNLYLFFLSILGMSILFGTYYYIQKKKKERIASQAEALENQRAKITADLHDEIGSTLSSLQLNAAIAQKMIEKDFSKTKNIIVKLEEQSQNLSEKIGDIIWSMKPGKDEFMTMSARIKNFSSQILGSLNVEYEVIIDHKLDKTFVDIETRKNIVFFTKEAINNVAKYSKAGKVSIVVKVNDENTIFEIEDNGQGFDTKIIKGNGIENMRKG